VIVLAAAAAVLLFPISFGECPRPRLMVADSQRRVWERKGSFPESIPRLPSLFIPPLALKIRPATPEGSDIAFSPSLFSFSFAVVAVFVVVVEGKVKGQGQRREGREITFFLLSPSFSSTRRERAEAERAREKVEANICSPKHRGQKKGRPHLSLSGNFANAPILTARPSPRAPEATGH